MTPNSDFESNVSIESSEVSLDQSNNGFSLVNLHWASFSTGHSSVIVVVLADSLSPDVVISGVACNANPGAVTQSCFMPCLPLQAKSALLSAHSPAPTQVLLPMPPRPPEATGPTSYPVAHYLAPTPSASCGLPGCATTYERQPTISFDHTGPSHYLPLSHEAFQAISYIDRAPAPSVFIIDRQPSAPVSIDRRPDHGTRQTGISSLHG